MAINSPKEVGTKTTLPALPMAVLILIYQHLILGRICPILLYSVLKNSIRIYIIYCSVVKNTSCLAQSKFTSLLHCMQVAITINNFTNLALDQRVHRFHKRRNQIGSVEAMLCHAKTLLAAREGSGVQTRLWRKFVTVISPRVARRPISARLGLQGCSYNILALFSDLPNCPENSKIITLSSLPCRKPPSIRVVACSSARARGQCTICISLHLILIMHTCNCRWDCCNEDWAITWVSIYGLAAKAARPLLFLRHWVLVCTLCCQSANPFRNVYMSTFTGKRVATFIYCKFNKYEVLSALPAGCFVGWGAYELSERRR